MLLKQPQASLFRNFGWIKDGTHRKNKTNGNTWHHCQLNCTMVSIIFRFYRIVLFKKGEKGIHLTYWSDVAVFSLCQSQQENLVKTCWHHHCRHLRIPASVLVSECSALKMRIAAVEEKGPDSNTNKDETPLWNVDAMGALFAAGICSVLTRCMVSGQNNTELKDKRLGKSVWLFLWVCTLAQRGPGWSNAGSPLPWGTNTGETLILKDHI